MYGAPEATFALLFSLTQYIELKKNNNANVASGASYIWLISLIGDIYTFHFLLLVFHNNAIKKPHKAVSFSSHNNSLPPIFKIYSCELFRKFQPSCNET